MVGTRSGKDHAANPPPTKSGRGRGTALGGQAQGHHRGTPSRLVDTPSKNTNIEDSILALVLNKAQEDAKVIFKATKAAYLNAKNYNKMDLLKSYLEQVISLFRVVQKFLLWKEILTKHLDGWNLTKHLDGWSPYTEQKHIKVLKNKKQNSKESSKHDLKKVYKIPKINRSKPQPLW
ncbi:hypothetical protein PTTG_28241 [Puccinia triticina 1-1 BBBD Race 1]|uniref:Uncharacterized protein n=1 Tax=Puccinia triticina (isolate 1-1 / race 1 (BBBD)) TaxID=630390 RepID=A0A180GDL8_PUCT1|nr:hypothetical protein PTTG_28241 [Puccinia triticina 1-1 BBBD Race 1]